MRLLGTPLQRGSTTCAFPICGATPVDRKRLRAGTQAVARQQSVRSTQGEPAIQSSTATRAALVDAPSAVEAPQTAQHAVQPYDWDRQWYPLAYVHDLDPGRPHPMELLGKRLVLWRDSGNEWHCFLDRCPHRLAPLSEGRIDSNGTTLMCSYHGWEFNGEGKCTRIPQAVDPKAHEVACSSSRASATTFPVQVKQGMLWVWGDASPTKYIDSAATPAAVLPDIDAEDGLRGADGSEVLDIGKRYARDFNYSWSILVENVMDSSHVPFAHHGVLGSRNGEGAGDVTMSPTDPRDPSIFSAEGVSMDANMAMVQGRKSDFKIQFIPPCLVRYYTPNAMGGKLPWSQMPMYIVPTAPGKSRVMWSFVMPKQPLPLMFKILGGFKPVWLDHLTRSTVFDGDGMMLHVAERTLAQETEARGEDWRRAYYMPAPADRVVLAFRQWLDARGGPPTPDSQLGPINWNKRDHLDRWNQHTKHCVSCTKAVKTFEALRIAAAAAGALALMGLLAIALSPAQVKPFVPALVAAGGVLAGLLWTKLGPLIQQFYYIPYDHQARN